MDDCSRECLAIEIDTSLTGRRVVAVLERLADERSLPQTIVVDNVLPEMSSASFGQLEIRRREPVRSVRVAPSGFRPTSWIRLSP